MGRKMSAGVAHTSLALVTVVALAFANAACDGRKVGALCEQEANCFDRMVAQNLSERCGYGARCEISVHDLLRIEMDSVYFVNKFGAHPNVAACEAIPISTEFKKIARFGCEYIVFANKGSYVGYALGSCDQSLVKEAPGHVVFSEGFDYPAIKLELKDMLVVERGLQDSMNSDLYYLNIDLTGKGGKIVEHDCLHF